MTSVRKTKLAFKIIGKDEAMAAMELYAYNSGWRTSHPNIDADEFTRAYRHLYEDTIAEIWKWKSYILTEQRNYPVTEVYDNYIKYVGQFDKEPTKWSLQDNFMSIGMGEWVFKGNVYDVKGLYSDDEIKLLILEDFDKERRYFEKLKIKFNEVQSGDVAYERPRIPESVRVEVWRRDGGKCARCSSREKLEYDHIVPISKGGNNTARNIELLCEKCNRSKSNNIV